MLTADIDRRNIINAIPIKIDWHPGLPIFASESFLKAVGDEYGWLGGNDKSGILRCILPYTVVKKMAIRMVRFRVETIQVGKGVDINEERSFLNSAMEFFRSTGVDIIIPATTNTIFRTYPDGSDAAPYGSYTIDLNQSEELLWKKIDRIVRQNINTARKDGVHIRDGETNLKDMYKLVVETFNRSKIPFMSFASFERYVNGLGDNSKIMIADYRGTIQSYVLFAFSDYCAYAIYAGNIANQHQGANKLLYWESIRFFKNQSIQQYDFVGARINPNKGSKEWAINSLKKRFGAQLRRGYLWKYSLRPVKSAAYNIAVRFFRGGDIVDKERHKMGLTLERAIDSQ